MQHLPGDPTRALHILSEALFSSREGPVLQAIAKALIPAMQADWALLGRLTPDGRVEALLASAGAGAVTLQTITYELAGTPCADVVEHGLCTHLGGVSQAYPQDAMLAELGIQSYCGIRLLDSRGEAVGVMSLMYRGVLDNADLIRQFLPLLADRAAAELEREAAQTALRESESRFRALIELGGDAVILFSAAAEKRYANPAVERVLGFTVEECLSIHGLDLVHPEDLPAVQQAMEEVRSTPGGSGVLESRVRHKDGRWLWTEVRLINLLEHPGVNAIACICRDITAERDYAEALRRKEAWFRSLVERCSEIIAVHDTEGKISYVSPAVEPVLGYTPAEILGIDAFSHAHPDDIKAISASYQEVLGEPNRSHSIAVRARHRDGGWRYLEGVVANLLDEQAVRGLVVNWRDATDERAVQLAREEREQRLRVVLEQAPGVLWATDRDLRITYSSGQTGQPAFISNASTEGYQLEDLLTGQPDLQELIKHHQQALSGQSVLFSSEWQGRTFQTRMDPLRGLDGAIIGVIAFALDVTERHHLEATLLQAQKMEAVGLLAGGIAHDFNNALAVINGYAEMALLDVGPQDPLRVPLEHIARAGERAVSLTRQLLAYSRKQLLKPRVVDVPQTIRQLSHMASRVIGEDIRLQVTATADIPSVLVDPGQLEQVVLNLVINARDAMPEGGSIYLHVEGAPSPETRELGVRITVRDTGCGIDAATLSRIWEPFFTTKPAGVGTGLGLSTVYGIVKQSGGVVTVESHVGEGTTFRVWLPACSERPAGQSAGTQRATGPEPARILLAEDDDMVRDFIVTALTAHGHTVLRASSGEEALEVARLAGPLDLLLTDVVMPGMSGRELAEALHAERPDLKVLFMSGYTEDAILRKQISSEKAPFISKPFSIKELLAQVQALLPERWSRDPAE